MAKERDWQADYRELQQQHEDQAAAHAEIAQVLIRTIVRLTLAAGGLDAKLEPHLRSIREAVRNGVNPELPGKLSQLSDDLLHLPDEDATEPAPVGDICSRLVSHFSLPPTETAEAGQLFTQLLTDPGRFSEQAQNRLVELLTPAVSKERQRQGLLGRLLGGVGRAGELPNEILLNLLEQAVWPGQWGAEISRLKARLSSSCPEDEWILVLQELLNLSANSYGETHSEIKETESFLEELTRRLQDLDDHLRNAHSEREEVVGYGRKMSQEVSSHVISIESSVNEAADLNQLQAEISARLAEIRQSMGDFLQQERAWYQKSEQGEQELRERLRILEKESSDLRLRMAEAHQLALQDAVTGLPNRLAYDERVEQEFARWKRFAEPLSMLIWDVDDFKSINDRFGHQAGDKALRVIAQSLRKRLRETDYIARYGGEEFVALLSGADETEALKVAEELRRGVMESGFHSNNRVVPVTVSCGISRFADGDTIETVFKRADKALYEAKRSGKNRCVTA